MGAAVDNQHDFIARLRAGLPVACASALVRSGCLTQAETDAVVSLRLAAAHQRTSGSLTPGESVRLLRAASVLARALNTFGSLEKSSAWLRRPTVALAGEAPVTLLRAAAGAKRVADLLGHIDHGIAT
ncbi:antitoxin Xre/MbcA/ParS toxin-binding domain-containing protein [Camelimonas fluminis]|uniref:antitoxin Xre/MbcA/ParS toxin-binding domain-containing protein n=1 Tax=Camelimonas fluminis TaxID=1576911 RepID=UPI0017485D9E